MTPKQARILRYLYQFRFITRNQLQVLCNHTHHSRINLWLNRLTENGYIKRYYNKQQVTVPALYSLGNKGRTYLQQNAKKEKVKPELLNRIWREPTLSDQFRHHCLQVVDVYLSLIKLTQQTQATLHFYTKTDLHGLQYLLHPAPDVYFSIKEINGRNKCYFLDIFDALPARMVLRKRVRQYFDYFASGYWQDHHINPFPTIICLCPDKRSYRYLTTCIQTQLANEPGLEFYLTTEETTQNLGFRREALTPVIPSET